MATVKGNALGVPFTEELNVAVPTCPDYGSIFKNPEFDCGTDYWLTVNSTLTVDAGVAHVIRQAPDASIYQSLYVEIGDVYEITFKINGTSDSGFLAIRGDDGADPYPLDYLAPGEYTWDYHPTVDGDVRIGVGVNGVVGDWVDFENFFVKKKTNVEVFDDTFDNTFN